MGWDVDEYRKVLRKLFIKYSIQFHFKVLYYNFVTHYFNDIYIYIYIKMENMALILYIASPHLN